jgi:asparagine synthase (glutamine-hydrolysing)
MYFLSALAAEHVKVVLSGQGADEALGGYRRYRGYLLSTKLPRLLAPVARGVARVLGARIDQLSRGIETLLATYQVFSPAEIESLTGRADYRSREVLDYAYQKWQCADLESPVSRMMRLDLRLGLADDLLLYTDRVTMRHSLECRVPYLDTELVNFIESLPVHYRVTLTTGKRIHRAAASRVLPPEIMRRKKKGFLSPTRLWFQDAARLKGIFADEGAGLSRFVDPGGIDKVIRKHSAGVNQERQIFLLLMLMFAVAA